VARGWNSSMRNGRSRTACSSRQPARTPGRRAAPEVTRARGVARLRPVRLGRWPQRWEGRDGKTYVVLDAMPGAGPACIAPRPLGACSGLSRARRDRAARCGCASAPTCKPSRSSTRREDSHGRRARRHAGGRGAPAPRGRRRRRCGGAQLQDGARPLHPHPAPGRGRGAARAAGSRQPPTARAATWTR
jgi:hypothetical protein